MDRIFGGDQTAAGISCHRPEVVHLITGCAAEGVIAFGDGNGIVVFDGVGFIDGAVELIDPLDAEPFCGIER